jgi:hypothetical protein
MVRTALARIKQFKEDLRRKWILHRHGYKDWDMYIRMTDPDILWRATRIVDFYHGYHYVYCIENRNHQAYYWDLGNDGGYQLHQWCRKNCKDKFRFDFHRVIKNHWGDWEVNEIGGGDYVFAAFKSERDFNWFMLKWS